MHFKRLYGFSRHLSAISIQFLSYFILVCQGNKYWVRPNTTVDCPTDVPTQRCVTLLDIAANNSRYFISNTQINFLAGVHYIQSDERLEIGVKVPTPFSGHQLLSNISLVGDQKAETVIYCNDTQVGFAFAYIDNFTFSNVAILHCSCVHSMSLDREMNVSLLLVNINRVYIWDMVIQNTIGTGLLISASKTYTLHVEMIRSRFEGNGDKISYGNVHIQVRSHFWGNHIRVLECTFADGWTAWTTHKEYSPKEVLVATGLSIEITTCMIIIENSTYLNNTGGHFAVNIPSTGHSSNLTILNCNFTLAYSPDDTGGVQINLPDTGTFATSFTFSGCTIANNYGGGLNVKGYLRSMEVHNNIFRDNMALDGAGIHISLNKDISIKHNMFIENAALRFGGALFVIDSSGIELADSEFIGNSGKWGSAISYNDMYYTFNGNTILRCKFTKNKNSILPLFITGSVLHLSNTEIVITDTIITDNECRGIHLNSSSVVTIRRDVWIIKNKAHIGAGMFLDYYPSCTKTSYIYMPCDSHLHIENNRARDYGGGLMVRSGCAVPKICFIRKSQCTGKIHMSGNTAGIAGTTIYGGDLENCFLEPLEVFTPEMFWTIFNITERHSGPSVVASQPYKVCICNDNFSTDHSCVFHYNVEVYPGQTFTVPAVGVGHYNYSSPAVIRAIAPQGVKLGKQQITQETSLFCTSLLFLVQTREKSVVIKLLITTQFSFTPSTSVLPKPTLINLSILDCPLGFMLKDLIQVCDCLPHLATKGITCNISGQTLHKSPSMWIGNFSDGIVAHKNCPFNYCDPSVQDVRLTSQDDQCNWNRTGILCGACRDGYSTVFGTFKCQECSNVYLLLLLPISLSGFGLVVLLLKCNLTVSTGTLNGLIFYANIVQVNSKMFFSFYPPGPMSTLSYVLSVFIAWINLDLGIEVCFAENLNAFSQTWLQFLFPVYIWCIIGLLIIVCRYSTTVSRLTGSNTVSVLATLFLLSYAKLLRTTLNIFSPITITDPNNTTYLRWILDANYGYLHWPHLTLFLAALLTLVLHLIPFTALLLFGPTLQAHTNYRLLSWVTRIKPFLDAYHGPYKTKHRYWTGSMLLVRVLLLTVFACNALGDPNINLLTIVVTASTLLVVWIKIGRIYRKWPINVLEVFYLLNLEIMAVATLYLNRASSSSDTQQQTLSLITVGSALLVFIAVIIYHCCTVLTETRRGRKLKQKIIQMYQNRATTQEEDEVIEPQVRASSPTRTEVNLRELLLEEKD